MKSNTKEIEQIIKNSNNIVFFGGAGVSTESGIPDFRSQDGIYRQKYPYPPERILSYSFFIEHPDIFYDFNRSRIIKHIINAVPNPAHIKLAAWEKNGKLKAVITQNIDRLHQKAGSREVLELHGSMYENYCMSCKKIYDISCFNKEGTIRCSCGGIIHPGCVLFEEALDESVITRSIRYIMEADVLITAGTSAVVYPAAGLIHHYKGKKMILINKDTSVSENSADYVVYGKVGEILGSMNI